MSSRFDLLTQQLFQKDINDCSIEELENLAKEFPYFAPAQYALAIKASNGNLLEHEAHIQKAVLYYHNPPLFHHFLHEENYHTEIKIPANEEVIIAEGQPETQEITITTPEEETSEAVLDAHVKNEISQVAFGNNDNLTEEKIEIKIQEAEAAPLVFEPYHTVDYFASQGIKLSQEEATKDALGKQLKSFTEWLKTMKRLPATEQIKKADPVLEQKVDALAAHSVEGAEVVTETMAEVWVKQGNREKALETYHKLSLLNPSKRAYFAAKVDLLKKEN